MVQCSGHTCPQYGREYRYPKSKQCTASKFQRCLECIKAAGDTVPDLVITYKDDFAEWIRQVKEEHNAAGQSNAVQMSGKPSDSAGN
jgi:hypothetical protein